VTEARVVLTECLRHSPNASVVSLGPAAGAPSRRRGDGEDHQGRARAAGCQDALEEMKVIDTDTISLSPGFTLV
jgi:hypothetical protein